MLTSLICVKAARIESINNNNIKIKTKHGLKNAKIYEKPFNLYPESRVG